MVTEADETFTCKGGSMQKIGWIFVLGLVVTNMYSDSKEYIQEQIQKYSQNVGFIKGEKRVNYQKQFPMCEEFIDVHWLDKKTNKSQRGWRYYTYYPYVYNADIQKDVLSDKEDGSYEMVEIEENGSVHYYGLYFIKKAFKETWKHVIQEMTITGNNEQFTLHYQSQKYDNSKYRFSMTQNYKNVCIVKPDEQTAVFYEMKRASKVLSDAEIETYLTTIQRDIKTLNYSNPYVLNDLKNAYLLDINNDGILDFAPIGDKWIARDRWIYSIKGMYHIPIYHRILGDEKTMEVYIDSEPKQGCITNNFDGILFLRGKELFYQNNNDICNLTQLTTYKGN